MKYFAGLSFFLLFLFFQVRTHAQNFKWGQSFGGPALSDFANAIACDQSGNIYLAGKFESAVDFDPGPGVATYSSAGQGDIFISKWSAGGSLLWIKTIGGTGDDGV